MQGRTLLLSVLGEHTPQHYDCDLPVGRFHTVGKAENMSVAQVMEEVQDDQGLLRGINLHCVLLSNKGKLMTLENINKCKYRYMYKGKRL